MEKGKKYNPYVQRGEHYIRSTAAKVLKKLKLNEDDFAKEEAKKYVREFNKLEFGEKIELIYSIIVLQEDVFKEYMTKFKSFHISGFGSIRELKDRRYCLKRTKELKAEFPDITGEEIYKTLGREILARRLEKKRLKNRKYR